MAKVKKNRFVYTAGIFGKYLLRGLVYLVENLIAFLGFIAIVAVTAGIAYAFGLTTAAVVASVTAATASVPTLTQLAVFAVPLAASEIIKKIYKDNLEWLVIAYKGLMTQLFTPKSFEITPEELAAKRAKHPENTEKYATLESYVAAKKTEYKLENLNKKSFKYPELEVAGRAGKRAFKAAALHISNGLYWLATTPSKIISPTSKGPKAEVRVVPENNEVFSTPKLKLE